MISNIIFLFFHLHFDDVFVSAVCVCTQILTQPDTKEYRHSSFPPTQKDIVLVRRRTNSAYAPHQRQTLSWTMFEYLERIYSVNQGKGSKLQCRHWTVVGLELLDRLLVSLRRQSTVPLSMRSKGRRLISRLQISK